ncbi:aldo/keto reductase [Moheibacter lacus]|uniref:Aldo/keto reductase n=1 Tax=Moheibacter lacus TaxID=2745851 RepID=A0A838ZPU4_9FLAO|nr:aldo/keto reductase [Moheibacter lacus]MBA5629916.1 aldo/keto reductase [Moheibacter lacus]
MQKRRLGNTELEVAPIAFGGNVFGWTIDQEKSFEIIDEFVGSGFNLIDTANNYSYWVKGNDGGESERIIGNWLKKRRIRDKVVIATKVGGRNKQMDNPNTTRKHIMEEVDKSLMRLQTDYIDLYQTHYDDGKTPIEETLSAYQDLIKEGKIRWIGASNISPERLVESLEIAEKYNLPKYQTLQPEYNLYERENYETKFEAITLENGLSVMNYYSLASGFLTGKYRKTNDLSQSQRGKDVQKYLDERGIRILNALDEISFEYKTTAAVVALAWLLNRPSITAPIVSATSLSQMEAIKQAPLLDLNSSALMRLNEASEY